MAALTGQELVSNAAKRLRSRFSDTEFAEIYKDKPVQFMKTPCIFIHSVETAHTPELRGYAWWNHTIDFRCHPGKMQTNLHSWARIIGPIVAECVQYLTVSDQQIKSRSATWRVEDDVLHVIVSYRYRVKQTTDELPIMESFTYGEKIKL